MLWSYEVARHCIQCPILMGNIEIHHTALILYTVIKCVLDNVNQSVKNFKNYKNDHIFNIFHYSLIVFSNTLLLYILLIYQISMILKRTQFSPPLYIHILNHSNYNRFLSSVPLKNIAFGDPLLMFMKDYEVIHY